MVGAALSLLLFLPSLAVAGKIPSLASTAQYKAFIAYVKELDGLVGQPATAAQKATYEAELTAKEKAAAHKANALFNRASDKAEAESNAMFKQQAAAIRGAEAEALEALQAEVGGKLERATASYHGKLERLGSGHAKFEARVREQISSLRAKKASTQDVAQKNAIQERISALIAEVAAKREEESTKRADLKAAFQAQKREIQAAADKQEAEIGEAAEAKIEKASKHWKRAYNEKKAALNAKRESQLGYLAAKLEKGRADIATMPAVG